MRFFLVTRDRTTGDVALPDEHTYATHEEALDAAAAAVTAGSAEDLFIVDLEGAAPVIVVMTPCPLGAPVGQASEYPAGVEEESAEEPQSTEAPLDEGPFEEKPRVDFGFAYAVRQAAEAIGVEPFTEPETHDEAPESAQAIEEPATVGAIAVEDSREAGPGEAMQDEQPAASSEEASPVERATAYRPAFADIETWTCEDCVYVVTCPSSGSGRPATCGSFQWKSV